MKNLEFKGNQLKVKGYAYNIDGFIELETSKKLSYEERLEVIKKDYDFDDEEIYQDMAIDNEYSEQIGRALIFFVDGEAQEFTKDEALSLDKLMEER